MHLRPSFKRTSRKVSSLLMISSWTPDPPSAEFNTDSLETEKPRAQYTHTNNNNTMSSTNKTTSNSTSQQQPTTSSANSGTNNATTTQNNTSSATAAATTTTTNTISSSSSTASAAAASRIPSVALGLHDILLSCQITDYEPRIIEQLLEITHKYTQDVISDARIFQRHTGAPKLEEFHVNLAVQSLMNHAVTRPPKVDTLLDLAKECNEKNGFLLPSEKEQQVLLPPERYCLSKMNYQLEKNKRQRTE